MVNLTSLFNWQMLLLILPLLLGIVLFGLLLRSDKPQDRQKMNNKNTNYKTYKKMKKLTLLSTLFVAIIIIC